MRYEYAIEYALEDAYVYRRYKKDGMYRYQWYSPLIGDWQDSLYQRAHTHNWNKTYVDVMKLT